MLKRLFHSFMERRSLHLIQLVDEWLPAKGPVLDLGSGTGHLSEWLGRERGFEVITADVSDLHIVGRPPVLITDDALPFGDKTFSAALLFFMLAYPKDPAAVLAEAARVTRGPIILVQTINSGRLGYTLHRLRELILTVVTFHVLKLTGSIPRETRFTMRARRFYRAHELERDVVAAGLRVRSRRERPLLPTRALAFAGWQLEPVD